MSHATCPNCGATTSTPVALEPPTTCADCCSRLRVDVMMSAAPFPRAAALDLDLSLTSGRDAPAIARHEFSDFAGDLDAQVASTGALLVSELVTNAVLHGPSVASSTIALHCAIAGATLQVEVADDGTGFVPRTRVADQDPNSGWGLHLVDSLAESWGVDDGRPTRVWFELAL